MYVFRLVAILENKILEKRVRGKWGGEEVGSEECRGIRENGGLGCGEEEWLAVLHDPRC